MNNQIDIIIIKTIMLYIVLYVYCVFRPVKYWFNMNTLRYVIVVLTAIVLIMGIIMKYIVNIVQHNGEHETHQFTTLQDACQFAERTAELMDHDYRLISIVGA